MDILAQFESWLKHSGRYIWTVDIILPSAQFALDAILAMADD
jgi:hypothetical protein